MNYEQMVEDKVFRMLNSYFDQKKHKKKKNARQTVFESSDNHDTSNQVDEIKQGQVAEIKQQTQSLQSEIVLMRKLVEDLSISVTEKDAEIINLKMHLGDEKQKQRKGQDSPVDLLPDHDTSYLLE